MADPVAQARIDALETTVGDLSSKITELSSRLAMLGLLSPGGEVVQPTFPLNLYPPIDMRLGNGLQPGFGFSGIRIAYPPVPYSGEDWHLAGVNNDVLQAGIRASDGKLLAGGGIVTLDASGIQIVQGAGLANAITWLDEAAGHVVARIVAAASGSDPNKWGQLNLIADAESGADQVGGEIYLKARFHDGAVKPLATISILGSSGTAPTINFQVYDKAVVANNFAGMGPTGTSFNSLGGANVDFIIQSGNNAVMFYLDAGTDRIGVGVIPVSTFTVEGGLTLKERAAAEGDTASYGQIWVKNTTPCELWFTDDAGTDTKLA